jgi:hypothetical protein
MSYCKNNSSSVVVTSLEKSQRFAISRNGAPSSTIFKYVGVCGTDKVFIETLNSHPRLLGRYQLVFPLSKVPK